MAVRTEITRKNIKEVELIDFYPELELIADRAVVCIKALGWDWNYSWVREDGAVRKSLEELFEGCLGDIQHGEEYSSQGTGALTVEMSLSEDNAGFSYEVLFNLK